MKLFYLFFAFLLLCLLSCQQTDLEKPPGLNLKHWYLKPAEEGKPPISNFDSKNWIKADVPTTVLHALVENGQFKNLYTGQNLKNVPESLFKKSWYYRTTFDLPQKNSFPYSILQFKGINYRANIWLNGQKIASADTTFGAFKVFEFEISAVAKPENNTLVVEVFPPQPGDYTLGFVDWNPEPPDKNMGLWRAVNVRSFRNIRIKSAYVNPRLDLKKNQAEIEIRAQLQNLSTFPEKGHLEIRIGKIVIQKDFVIGARETKDIVINKNDSPHLVLNNPRLWWPYTLGTPHLYTLTLSVFSENKISDQQVLRFGIRQVEDFFTSQGYRGFKINGKKVLIRGAGWTDALMLEDTRERTLQQLLYVKNSHLNTIRLEGFWGKDQAIYDLCDSLGIMVMVGNSCQWEWENYLGKACDRRFGGATNEKDMDLLAQYWTDQIKQIRNHPSVIAYFAASDLLPAPELEKRYLNILKKLDDSRVYLASAGNYVSEVSGPTGMKMNGPYDYVPPIYWYADSLRGSAFGFNTETGPGPQLPVLSSLKRMLPPQHRWPIDNVWNYHCGRGEFNTLARFRSALENRYGPAETFEDFVFKAQVQSYEAIRPMFEAFARNKFKATGVIQWMLTSAWPAMFWQLYDYYLMPTAAYYGVKKACSPLQLILDYKDKTIHLNNETLKEFNDLTAQIRLYDLQSHLLLDSLVNCQIGPNDVKTILQVAMLGNSPVHFLDLRLFDAQERTISSNFYWLSKKEDVLDFANSTWYVTPIKKFADFRDLNNMPRVDLNIEPEWKKHKKGQTLNLKVSNATNRIAFFVYFEIQTLEGQPVTPVFWQDNYISLLPKENRELTARVLNNEPLKLLVKGWNVNPVEIK